MTGRLEKHLDSLIQYKGEYMTCREYYKQVQADGYDELEHYTYADGVNSYRLINKNKHLYEIPKMVYDWLANEKQDNLTNKGV